MFSVCQPLVSLTFFWTSNASRRVLHGSCVQPAQVDLLEVSPLSFASIFCSFRLCPKTMSSFVICPQGVRSLIQTSPPIECHCHCTTLMLPLSSLPYSAYLEGFYRSSIILFHQLFCHALGLHLKLYSKMAYSLGIKAYKIAVKQLICL